MTDILNVPMHPNDAGVDTVGQYLRALLTQLWRDADGFSGKRPFGESGWQWQVYNALAAAGVIAGLKDVDDDDDEVNWDIDGEEIHHADAMIAQAIRELFENA